MAGCTRKINNSALKCVYIYIHIKILYWESGNHNFWPKIIKWKNRSSWEICGAQKHGLLRVRSCLLKHLIWTPRKQSIHTSYPFLSTLLTLESPVVDWLSQKSSAQNQFKLQILNCLLLCSYFNFASKQHSEGSSLVSSFG